MILRIWRAEIRPARLEEYRRFEQERCRPMLRKQPGLLGALFLREPGDRAVSITNWEDRGAVEALGSSPSYRKTARELAARKLVAGDSRVEVLEVEGGDLRLGETLRLAEAIGVEVLEVEGRDLRPEALAAALGRITSKQPEA